MTFASKSARLSPPSKAQVLSAVSVGMSRAVSTAGGKGALADRVETSSDTIGRAMSADNVPSFHVLLGTLLIDPTALNEALALVGMQAAPLNASAANDMELVGSLSSTVTEFLHRLADGKRCHVDTAILAELFRRVIPQMQAIVSEHDARVAA